MKRWYILLLVVAFAITWQPASCLADICPTCHGNRTIPCPRCKGSGAIDPVDPVKCGGLKAWHGCPDCGGTYGDPCNLRAGTPGSGQIQCPSCGGAGQVPGSAESTNTQTSSVNAAAERARALEAQRLKDEALAKQRREEFEKAKQDALRSMKGITENELGLKSISTSDDLGLKGVGETKTDDPRLKGIGEPARDVRITNPQIAKIMAGLRAIQVPPPLPQKEVSLSWKNLSLNNRYGKAILEWGGDVGFLAWELTGRLGSKVPFYSKVLLIIPGRVFIAGEEGAYVHLVKQDKIYEEALHYLKDPTTSRRFAELVGDLKEGNHVPESADVNMVRAARAILDPSLGSCGMRIAWDSMLSPEARAAMVRKACLEVGAELVGTGVQGLVGDLTKRKELYEAARLEREEARRMLKQKTISILDKDQLKKVVAHANHVLEDIYRLEQLGPGAAGELGAIYAGGEAERASEQPGSKEK